MGLKCDFLHCKRRGQKAKAATVLVNFPATEVRRAWERPRPMCDFHASLFNHTSFEIAPLPDGTEDPEATLWE